MKKVKRRGYYRYDKSTCANPTYVSRRAMGIRNEWIYERAREEAGQIRKARRNV